MSSGPVDAQRDACVSCVFVFGRRARIAASEMPAGPPAGPLLALLALLPARVGAAEAICGGYREQLAREAGKVAATGAPVVALPGDPGLAAHVTLPTAAGEGEFRVEFTRDGEPVSPWHGIGWRAGAGGVVRMVVEIPRFTRPKLECTKEARFNVVLQDTRGGQPRFYETGDVLTNYGFVPQTWEDPGTVPLPGDNDPIDVLEVGQPLAPGSVVDVKVLGVIPLVDSGEIDHKIVAIRVDDVLAPRLDDLDDLQRELPGTLAALVEFLRTYKGLPYNTFLGPPQGVAEALGILETGHAAWAALVQDDDRESTGFWFS